MINVYCVKKITNDLLWVGANDRRLAMFEGVYSVPTGVSYNSYLLTDEKTVLFDTVDKAVRQRFMENVIEVLGERTLDYLVVQHMEPDHSAAIQELVSLYPEMKIVCNVKTLAFIGQFYDFDVASRAHVVKENDTLCTGRHTLHFVMAPMVHWPEVMVTYDETDRVLFSADAFGTFGTLDGGVIDKEMNTDHFWNEMVRYYSNIVGKYGNPVQKALQKLSGVDIDMICSTHGPVWCEQKAKAIEIYDRLSRYEGLKGVTLIYGSMYGHTEQMADAIASALSDGGVRDIVIHNVSHSHPSYILRDIFNYKGVIIGSPTYSNQIFPEIESLLGRIEHREIKNRLFGYFGEFTWAGAAVKRLASFGEAMKWEIVGNPVEQKQNISTEEQCIALGKAMACSIVN